MSELERIAAEVAACTKCILHRSRLKAVPGEGPEDAALFFIGEGPGFHENRQGRPFVGAAGQFLEELLASIGMKREEVFIANVVKCRPPGNRDPLPEEIETCRPYLDRQLEVVSPKLIVTLGRFSMARYFPEERISRIHGILRRVGGLLCYPMYHPAAALHQPALKRAVEEDMLKIPELLKEALEIKEREEKEEGKKPPAQGQQLSLF